jgi:hypothetical protein
MPLLPPGTLVKPQVRGLTFHWLRVVAENRRLQSEVELWQDRYESERQDQHRGTTRRRLPRPAR